MIDFSIAESSASTGTEWKGARVSNAASKYSMPVSLSLYYSRSREFNPPFKPPIVKAIFPAGKIALARYAARKYDRRDSFTRKSRGAM